MPKKINFETSIERLEVIVRRLEEGDVPLEESIALYEEGMKLGAKCKKMLDDAEQRVKRLTVEIEKEGA